MKLERISDNQIRCTLNKEDLLDRELKISELAYGTEKAKELFRDMMQQASYELGFEAEDIPLMIEAIPLSSESLVLIITKVEDPDELDTRFSNFSSDSDMDTFDLEEDDVLDFPVLSDGEGDFSDVIDVEGTDTDAEKDFIPLSNAIAPGNVLPQKQVAKKDTGQPVNTIRIFSFESLDEVISLAQELNGLYKGANSLYKDTENEIYYLIMSKDSHGMDEFNRICNLTCEFGKLERNTYATMAYFQEHYKLIAKADALHILENL